jgi:hypothetical protein
VTNGIDGRDRPACSACEKCRRVQTALRGLRRLGLGPDVAILRAPCVRMRRHNVAGPAEAEYVFQFSPRHIELSVVA